MAKYKNTKNKQSALIQVIAVVLVLVLIAYLICSAVFGTFNLTKWGKTSETDQTTPTDDEEDAGGLIVTPDNGSSASLMSLRVTPYSATSSSALSEYEITAEITPSNATYQEVDWAIAWDLTAITENGFIQDGWDSSGDNTANLTEDDYVTVTSETDGALKAVLSCYEPFGCPITLTCTSRDNPEISATCSLDFKQIITKAEIIADDYMMFTDTSSTKEINAKISWGIGTLSTTYSIDYSIAMEIRLFDNNENEYHNAFDIVGTYKDIYNIKKETQSFTTLKNSASDFTYNLMSYDVAWSSFAPTYLLTHDSSASDIQKLQNLQIAKDLLTKMLEDEEEKGVEVGDFCTNLTATDENGSSYKTYKYTNINEISLGNVTDPYTYVSGITLPNNVVFKY